MISTQLISVCLFLFGTRVNGEEVLDSPCLFSFSGSDDSEDLALDCFNLEGDGAATMQRSDGDEVVLSLAIPTPESVNENEFSPTIAAVPSHPPSRFSLTAAPVVNPNQQVTERPTMQTSSRPSVGPATIPIINDQPSKNPSRPPSGFSLPAAPIMDPNQQGTERPTMQTSSRPSVGPTTNPSINDRPSETVNETMTGEATIVQPDNPKIVTTKHPTTVPSLGPSTEPSTSLSSKPSVMEKLDNPSILPSNHPTPVPSLGYLSEVPSDAPSLLPSNF